jgi:glycerol-3-phosphate cytidylyltransferase-like family protein
LDGSFDFLHRAHGKKLRRARNLGKLASACLPTTHIAACQ